MSRNKPTKKEITLMTLLANEATADSRKLLKKYNKADAKDCADLEVKLAQLYFGTPDKLAIEKDFAEIHPHKNWILKRTKVEEVEKPEVVEIEQPKSSAEGDCGNPNCPVHGKCCITLSNADGMVAKEISTNNENQSIISTQQNLMIYSINLIGIIAVAGIVLYALNKNKS
jgi:hypothetical protein